MGTLQPEGSALKKAVQYVSEKRESHPDLPLVRLVDEASFRFDLSPKDAEFLGRLVKQDQAT